jgi:HAD superfamily hydrolase (TIGR01509 family)
MNSNDQASPGICGVIFDLDGTLVDSRLDFPAMRAETGCPAGTGLLEYQAQLASAHERQRMGEIIHRHEMSGAMSASWMPGAQALLARMDQAAMPIGIFTRNSRQAAGLMIESLGIPCTDLVAREDAAAKPDPEGLHLLIDRWQLPLSGLLSVGDFHYDLEAASNAGVIACLYDPLGDSPFREQADRVIRHFDELLAPLFGD